jgi:hypothetical protein
MHCSPTPSLYFLENYVPVFLPLHFAFLPTFLTHNMYYHFRMQWVMMTDILIMMRDRQVTLTPRVIALCSGNFPPAVKEKMVRMIRGVPSSSSGTVGGSEETAQPSQHKATKSISATAAAAGTLPKKTKKARKAKKAPIGPSDLLVPSLQEASAGQPSDTDSAQHTSQGKKRVKC